MATGVLYYGACSFDGKDPLAPLEGVKMARKKMFVTHAKASRELGFIPGRSMALLSALSPGFAQRILCPGAC